MVLRKGGSLSFLAARLGFDKRGYIEQGGLTDEIQMHA